MGFNLQQTEALTGKTISALKKSKAGRNELVAMFGGLQNLPSSVMQAKREVPQADRDLPASERGYKATAPLAKKGRYTGKDRDVKTPKAIRQWLGTSGGGCAVGALSTFPQNIGRSMVLLYSDPGQVVFDPFAGHNSRMELTVKTGRNYVGCDLSTTFMEFNVKRAAQLRVKFPKVSIDLHHCDSRRVPVSDNIGDFSLTSPPYYDIEYYGDEPEQLGKCDDYKTFLKELFEVVRETYRVLKSGAYSIWFINDFRRDGVFYSYHTDMIRLGRKAGFALHDTLIVDFGRGFGDCFANRMMLRKILPKRHEYGIVFRKP